MPYSFTKFDNEIRGFVRASFPDLRASILDVGVGAGKYREILFDYPNMDGVEVWQPNIKRFSLQDRYKQIFCNDVITVPIRVLKEYDLIIFGDVIEHLEVRDAQRILAECKGIVIVAVPYEYIQGEHEGNPYEEHKQDDLTHEIFMDRYPGFKVLIQDETYGIYINDSKSKAEGQLMHPKRKEMVVDKNKLKGASVVIATPLLSGNVSIEYTASLCETLRRFIKEGIDLTMMAVSGHSVGQARNRLVASFMANEIGTHLLFIDGDHGWIPENPLRLLAMEKDIVGIVARKKTTEVRWAANIPEGNVYIDEAGSMEICEIGTGFLMISRSAIQKMFSNYPELHVVHPNPEASQAEKDNYYSLFQFHIDEDGIERSEDITFCRRWKAMGVEGEHKVWCDPSVSISHIGSYDYRGSVSSLFEGVRNDKS